MALPGAEKEARALATTLRKFMLEYDQQVQLKAEKEAQFYLEQRKTLQDLWLPGNIPTEKDAGDSKTIATDDAPEARRSVKSSVPFLKILGSANRDAHTMAETLTVNASSATTVASIIDHLEMGMKEDAALFLNAQAHQQAIRQELSESLTKIDLQDARRKEIRETIVKLEANPSTKQQLKQLYEIGKAAKAQFKKQPK